MRDAASGGSGPTNKTSNGKSSSNAGNTKNRNVNHPERSGDRYSIAKFKGKLEGL